MTRVFYVGDNRTTVNWGRSASLALGQLLSQSFEITGRVTGNWFALRTADVGYVNTLMPARYARYASRMLHGRGERRVFGLYAKMEFLFGARDFIADDPAQSVENLLTYKDRYPALAALYDQISQADAVVADGDGDIFFSTPPRREALFIFAMLALGIRLGKRAFLVNTMLSDCPTTGRNQTTFAAAKNILERCAAVALRDTESLDYARKEMPGVNASCIPDSLFAWAPLFDNAAARPPANGDFLLPHPERDEYWGRLDFSRPYVCIGGGAVAAREPKKSIESYGRLVDAVRALGYPVCLTENDAPDSFLQTVAREKNIGIVPANAPILMCGAVLANARLFISGRYHPSIFASLGGTPCIFLASHAHKMSSLPRLLGYDNAPSFSAMPTDAEIPQIVATAKTYLGEGDQLRTRIRSVATAHGAEAAQLPSFIQRHMA